MKYLGREHLDTIFKFIQERYTANQSAPNYSDNKEGVEKLIGVFDGVKMDNFYPFFYDKITYLLTQINSSHFFYNGNKRLALVCALFFILGNDYRVSAHTKELYGQKLSELFPDFKDYFDEPQFTSEDFGYYNLSVIIADREKYCSSFELLKARVKLFLEFSLEANNQSD